MIPCADVPAEKYSCDIDCLIFSTPAGIVLYLGWGDEGWVLLCFVCLKVKFADHLEPQGKGRV